jgi:hypothetical protein
MSSTHRPLSAWIAHLSPANGQLGPVNDGDHRCDARTMDYFIDGWHRVAVPWGTHSHALGLARDDGTTVVELNDFGAPIAVSPLALEVVDYVERNWPMIDGAVADRFPSLAGESLSIRYWLLERLDAEGDPPDEIFAILPWDLLDRAVEAVSAGLKPGGELGELVEIRHWLTPAVRGVTGPLEQLDHGLRNGEGVTARLGASTLLANLRDIPVSRIPERFRAGLSRLVTTLAGVDPLYRHTSRVVAALLTGQAPISRIRTDLHSNLEAAAGTQDVREHVEVLGDDFQRIQVVETQAGWVRVTARIPRKATANSPLSARVGAFLPIRLVPRGGRVRRYWIALSVEDGELVGTVAIALAPGWSTLDADDAPVGAQELTLVDPDELVASLHVSTARTAQRWLDVAELLPADHPIRLAANTFEDSL